MKVLTGKVVEITSQAASPTDDNESSQIHARSSGLPQKLASMVIPSSMQVEEWKRQAGTEDNGLSDMPLNTRDKTVFL